MMTALVSVKLCKKFKIDIKKEGIKVAGVASNIRGTTACLKKGDVLSVEQMLYGMLLPSGNDAAFCLASFFGKMCFERYNYGDKEIESITSF